MPSSSRHADVHQHDVGPQLARALRPPRAPSSASPTTSMSVLRLEDHAGSRRGRAPGRRRARPDRRRAPSSGQPGAHARSRRRRAARPRARRRRARRARASRRARGRRRGRSPAAGAVVDDLDLERVGAVAQRAPRRARSPGVLERVRERLLHDPVGGQVDARRQRPRLALDAQLDRQPGAAHLREQRVELVERPAAARARAPRRPSRSRPTRRRISTSACAAGLLRRRGAPRRARRVALRAPRSAAPAWTTITLDGVRDHVVQLAGDPRPLLGDRRRSRSRSSRSARCVSSRASRARERIAAPTSTRRGDQHAR